MNVSGPPGFAYAYMFNPRGEQIIAGIMEETHARLLQDGHALPHTTPDFRVGYSPKRINDGMGKYVADAEEVRYEYGLEILPSLEKLPAVDAVVLAVSHDKFKDLTGEPCGISGSNR